MGITVDNAVIAQQLREAAQLLEGQGANPFRVGAYRRGAETLEALQRPAAEILAESGPQGLIALPAIGSGLAAAIAEIVATGGWIQLERLRGSVDPVQVLQTVPGVGPELARRLHDALHVDTLQALENACRSGEIRTVQGVGPRRAAAIAAAVAAMLDRRRLARRQTSADPAASHALGAEPDVELLLAIDRQYRDRAAAGALPTIAPRRFNPVGASWLPVLHTERDGWHFTALFSNTARAHELGRTQDWVVVYFYDDQHVERQRTVVTETRGSLQGERVVRGREAECRDLHRVHGA